MNESQKKAVMNYASIIGCSDEIVRKIGEVFDFEVVAETTDGGNNLSTKKIIKDMLTELAIPAGVAGYNNLAEAVYMVYKDKSYLRCITSKVYPEIAKNCYGSTAFTSNVERTIRHALEMSWKHCPPDKLEDFFGVMATGAKMKNKDVIVKLSERLEDVIGARDEQSDEVKNVKVSEANAKRIIRAMLSELVIPSSISGYKRIEEATYLIYEDESYIHSAGNRLYPQVAHNLHVPSTSAIERSIRHAIEIALKNCPRDRLIKYFGEINVNKKIKNKDFMVKLAEKLHYVDLGNAESGVSKSMEEMENDADSEEKIKRLIRELLTRIAIHPKVSGYRHLTEAVYIVYKNPQFIKSLNQYVFAEIAEKNGYASKQSITVAIRYAILASKKEHADLDFWKNFNGDVTTKNVIARLVQELTNIFQE